MVTDNTQDRIDEVNNPNNDGLVVEHTQNRGMVANSADPVRHGLDDSADHDAEKGAALGGLGGVAVGAAAGSIAGPVGTIIGAIAGGLVGAGASGAAVAAIDSVDNDNTITGVGGGVTRDSDIHRVAPSEVGGYPVSSSADHGHNVVTGGEARTEAGDSGLLSGAVVGGVVGAAVGGPVGAVVGGTLGSLAGGVAGDASEAADEESLTTRGTGTTEAYTPETNVIGNPGIRNPGSPMAGMPADTTMGTPMTGVGTAQGDGHNVVTGGQATTKAGDDGLVGGAVVGGVVGAAVGGPVGAVVGGTLGSLAGGVAGDAAEASTDDTGEGTLRVNSRDV